MKSEFIIKWLRYFKDRSDREFGSIWIMLLVILIICGALGAILLPRFFVKKVEYCIVRDECFNNVRVMNHAQQAFYLKKQNFSTNPKRLRLEFPLQTESYQYKIIKIPSDRPTAIANLATPIIDNEKAYLGIVLTTVKNGDRVTIGKVCESENSTGKNPTWENLPTQGDVKNFNCDDITVGGQPVVDLGFLSFSRVSEEESE